MSLARQIAHNTIIQIIGKALVLLLALIAFGLITRYLGQEKFGYYVTIYAFLQVFGILIDFGLQMSTVQLISNPNENESEILSNVLTIRFFASLIFLGLAPLIVLFFPYPSIVKIGVAIAAFGFVLSSLISILTGLFQKYLIMDKVVIADIFAKILFLIIILIIIFLKLGLLAIIGAIILDNLFNFIILFYFAKKLVYLKLTFNFLIWKKILKKTWPLAVTIALNLIYFKGDIIILSLLRSQAEVGIYGAPYKVLEVLISLVYIFLGLILPLLAANWAIKNLDQLKNIIQKTFDFLTIITLPLIVGTYFLGVPLMVLVAGKEFYLSGELLKILMLAAASIFIASLFGYVVVAIDKQKQMIKFYLINAIVSLIGYLIFIPLYGMWGAAWMTIFTEIFILFTAFYVMNHTFKFYPNLKIVLKSAGASLIMSIPLYFLSSLNLLVLLFLAGITYFLSLYLLKGFSKETILEIIKLKSDKLYDN